MKGMRFRKVPPRCFRYRTHLTSRPFSSVVVFFVLGACGHGGSPKEGSWANACVQDVSSHGARILLERHGAEIAAQHGRPARLSDLTEHCLESGRLPDLDGDGVEETDVRSSCYWGTYGAAHVVYFSNRGCLKLAGDLVDGELHPVDDTSFGVRGLEARWSNGCAGNDFAWTRYRWDGAAYRVADKATCHLCPERPAPEGAPMHPYCAAELERRERE